MGRAPKEHSALPLPPAVRLSRFANLPPVTAVRRRIASVWRQWAFVKDGWAFVVVSVIAADNEAQLLTDVKRMLASFEVVRRDVP